MNIIAISGSLRKGSFNTSLVRSLQALAPEGMQIVVADISTLPLYNQDDEAVFPPVVQQLKNQILAADGVIIATPEYNRSISGVLKNAIDWVSRPYGQNAFSGKAVLTMGVSSGKIGTAVAQSHLRQILNYLDTRLLGQPELYLGPASEIFKEGVLVDDRTRESLKKALETLKNRLA